MAVISISITASEEEIVSGIPRTVSISTNIPAIIFYTLDGSVPTLFSTQYTGPIFLPTDQLTIILNILATNGTDFSPIITEIYQTDMVDGGLRFSHNDTNQPPGFDLQGLFPFGDNEVPCENTFGNPANVGITVDNPALPATPTGFDGQGNPSAFTNHPFNTINYNIPYSTRNAEGETGPGIGTLPGKVKVDPPEPSIGPEQTDQFSNTFDPRAFVIFQDLSKENPNDPPQINRMSFTLENQERARDGNAFFNTGLDAPPPSGGFLRSHFNPRTSEMTYYYFDSTTNKWIISTQPFSPQGNTTFDLSGGRAMAGTVPWKVIEWVPFKKGPSLF